MEASSRKESGRKYWGNFSAVFYMLRKEETLEVVGVHCLPSLCGT